MRPQDPDQDERPARTLFEMMMGLTAEEWDVAAMEESDGEDE